MTPRGKGATLRGLVNPVDVTPAFAIPVFQWEGGGNDTLVQIIGRDGRVEGFTAVEIGQYHIMSEIETHRIESGQQALWAFQWDTARWSVTTRRLLSEELRQYSQSANLPPMLELAIARFLDRAVANTALVRRAFYHLSQYSPESAALWRDLIVLLPAVRIAIQEGLALRSKAAWRAVNDITLACAGRSLRISVPASVLSGFNGDQEQLLHTLNPVRSIVEAFDIDRFEIIDVLDYGWGDVDSNPDQPTRPVLTLVPLSQIGASLATSAGKHPGLRTVGLGDLLPDRTSRLSPAVDARAGDMFLIFLSDTAHEIVDAERLASSLVGRGCLAAAIVARPYNASSSPEATTAERQYDKLARAARWVAIVGGPQTSGHALQPLVDGAEPSRNSPTHIGKWLVRAFLEAAKDALTERQALDLAFKPGRGPKFAAVGVGSASKENALAVAVDAAFASASASLLSPKSARAIVAFLIRGPNTAIDARQQCIDHIKRNVRPETEIRVHDAVLPTLKNRVRVVLLARGFPPESFSWTPPVYLETLRDYGWSYTRLREAGEELDLEIWQGSAEFGVIVDLDRRLATGTDIETTVSEAPMYRGPVILVLGYLPDIKMRNELLLHGIIVVSIERLDLLNNLVNQPFRTIVSRLLRAQQTDILRGMAVLVRDQLMRLLWQEDSDVIVWGDSDLGSEPFKVPGWLTDTEPREGKLEGFQLDGRGPGRVLFFSGVLSITPAEGKAGYPTSFGFKIAIDDQGLRLREPMRFPPSPDEGGSNQLKLDL